MLRHHVIVEAAVDAFGDAVAAAGDGVDRIELCGPLHDGGTTPDLRLLDQCLARLTTPIHVLVRPRAGDFVYGRAEIAHMARDIRSIREAGAAGVVTGALTAEGTVDNTAMAALIEAAGPLPVGFHRAFDRAADQFDALDVLVSLGVNLILTSGAAPTALEGADRLRALVGRAGDRIGIIAAGSITALNVGRVLKLTGARQVHGRAFSGLAAAARGASRS